MQFSDPTNPAAQTGYGARRAGRAGLAQALQDSRADTLATFAAVRGALPDLRVPQQPGLNPPLWELGHIGWFQAWWLGRNPERHRGSAANPDAPRRPPPRAAADALYDSSRVPHASRWSLPLPSAEATTADLAAQVAESLALLADPTTADDDDGLYFHRLALFHEDMHHEAALYMAQALGLDLGDAHRQRWAPPRLPAPAPEMVFDAARITLGVPAAGFAFDNEIGAHAVALPPFRIDAQPLRWAEWLPFAEAGGYADARLWSTEGWAAQQASGRTAPRYLRHADGVWQRWRDGRWAVLALDEPAAHLSAHEAEAWCRWAGRRLPSEAEWQHAALTAPAAFAWGAVWEWTASTFAPWPAFRPHPYRDYSAPWFGNHRVLRGASWLTQPRLRHPHYRNFFLPGRTDVPAGLRTCAI